MIADRIENLAFYAPLHPAIARAAEMIMAEGFFTHADGPVETGRDDLSVSFATYSTAEEKETFEYHRVMADLQVMVEGEEMIEYSAAGADLSNPAFEKADIAFTPAQSDGSAIISKGTFAIYWPGELHKPGLAVGEPKEVRKAVFKIKVN